jgi:hypothetical protein
MTATLHELRQSSAVLCFLQSPRSLCATRAGKAKSSPERGDFVAFQRINRTNGRSVNDHRAYEDPLPPASVACAIEVARRRTGIESVIGHMKSEGHLGRCYLSATSSYGGIATVDAVPRLGLCTEELNKERYHPIP